MSRYNPASLRLTLTSLLVLAALCCVGGCKQKTVVKTRSATPSAETQLATGEKPGGPSGERNLDSWLTLLTAKLAAGTVDVASIKQGEQPKISWEIQPATGPQAAKVETLQLIIGQDKAGQPTLRDIYTGGAEETPPNLHVTVKLPATLKVDISLDSGSLRLNSKGSVRAHLGDGTLLLSGMFSDSAITMGNGKVMGSMLLKSGEHKLTLDKGEVKLRLIPGSDVEYEFSTDRGKIDLGGLSGVVERSVHGARARGKIGQAAAALTLQVGDGSIDMDGPADDVPVTADSH